MLTIDYRYFPLQRGDCVLDLGCGEGRHVIDMYTVADITAIGVDLSLRDIKIATERFAPFKQHGATTKAFYLQVVDGAHLPFADNTFDKIVCSEVLEHLQNYHAVLAEIRRVLKPHGLLAISVPRAWPEKICWRLSSKYHQVEGGHVRIFNASALREKIENMKFRFTSRHWAHALHTPFWWFKCLWWDTQNNSTTIRLYHRLLVWDLMQRPWLTRTLEKALNPILGKSVVMYFEGQAKEQQP